MKILKSLALVLASWLVVQQPIYADSCARIDVGPAIGRLDVLESNKTVKRINIVGVKGDATIMVMKDSGLCIKPQGLYGKGHDGEIWNGGIGVGYCIPVYDWLTVTPSIGCAATHLQTEIDVPLPLLGITLHDVKETFRSTSPYVGLDVTYRFNSCWRVYGIIQYSWSHTKTTLKGLLKVKSKTQGFNYAAVLERDLNEKWSVNLGAAYNLSLSKEKHGLRGAGVKIGITYWL